MARKLPVLAGSVLFVLGMASACAEVKPKYGPEATLLSASHAYLQKNAAPDYWALIPYYVSQQDDRSCSVASVSMVVNAARSGRKLTADDELATQKGLLVRAKSETWSKGVGDGGHGVNLDELGPIVEAGLKAYGVADATAEVHHTDDTSRKVKDELHHALVENEKSASDFIIINFIQGVYTGDAEAGHIAPIAAYDAKAGRVLVLDPDRQWYEPYWVSEATLLKGMATADKTSGKSRGFVWVKLKK
ncbi:MAG: hypothetical protein HY074_00840 [Deltaproteobacteria bacterium]|nr:hypothetical protein [Deltaproteobacteria bacterium]